MFKKIVGFVLILFFYLFPVSVHAAEYFEREYDISYTVLETGMTQVKIDVALTNKTSDYYASSDKIQLGFSDITNLTAHDPSGSLEPTVTSTDEGIVIDLDFKSRVVGQGNSLLFTIQFETSDVALKQGNIWEINIPGVANPETFRTFNVFVSVPESFGKPAYIKPKQPDNELIFTKDELGTSGISIAYGDRQYYEVDLIYHLQNRNVFPISTEIALPPSTAYQEVSIDSISPRPQNVTLDQDGNWLAEYHLLPSEKFDVRVQGKIQVYLQPRKKETLTAQEWELYTKQQQYWESNKEEIGAIARDLKTPEKIYQYVVDTLRYDFERVTSEQTRLGAVQAMANPHSAVCLEFTDLFVAIARAAGIPTREVNGFAYTQDQRQRPLSVAQDILHSWPEYYDSTRQQWVMVDPTWGNTTGGIDYFNVFDFDHLVFVRKGVDSTYPVPAGGYKFSGDEAKKDVHVSFTSPFILSPARLSVESEIPQKVQSGLPITGVLKVANTGTVIVEPTVITVSSSSLTPNEQAIQVPPLPPFGTFEVPFGFSKTPFLTNTTLTFTMSDGNVEKEGRITVVPFTITKPIILGGVGIGLFSISIFITARKSWRLRIFR